MYVYQFKKRGHGRQIVFQEQTPSKRREALEGENENFFIKIIILL